MYILYRAKILILRYQGIIKYMPNAYQILILTESFLFKIYLNYASHVGYQLNYGVLTTVLEKIECC